MAVYTAKLSSKGQITLPVEVRKAFALKEGDSVDFYVDSDRNEMLVRARNVPISSIFGFLKWDGPPVTIEQMDEAIAEAVTEDDERIKNEWSSSAPKAAE